MLDKRSEFLQAVEAINPAIVPDVVDILGSDQVASFFVRPETMFDADSVYERQVAFALTNHRLILFFSDTNYELNPRGEFVTTAQSVALRDIREHHIIRRRGLEGDRAGQLNSVMLRLRWGSGWTQDLQPAACDDPACTNDHGYVGMATNEDFQIFLDALHDSDYFSSGIDFVADVVHTLGAIG